MAEPHGTDPSAQIQLIVDLLARSLNRAVLLDDTAMTPMTFSRQLGTVDDVRMHSLLERLSLQQSTDRAYSKAIAGSHRINYMLDPEGR